MTTSASEDDRNNFPLTKLGRVRLEEIRRGRLSFCDLLPENSRSFIIY